MKVKDIVGAGSSYSCATWYQTLWVSDRKTIEKSGHFTYKKQSHDVRSFISKKLHWKVKSLKVRSARLFLSSIFTILPNGDNDNEAVLKVSQNNIDRHKENGSLITFNSKGDTLRIAKIQTSLVVSYKILQIWSVFARSTHRQQPLRSKFYICACARTAYIPKTSRQILHDNSWTESPGLKHLCAFCSWMPVWCVKSPVYIQ